MQALAAIPPPLQMLLEVSQDTDPVKQVRSPTVLIAQARLTYSSLICCCLQFCTNQKLAAEVLALASNNPVVRTTIAATGHVDVFLDVLQQAQSHIQDPIGSPAGR